MNVKGSEYLRVRDKFDLSNQAVLHTKHEGYLHRSGPKPGGSELAVNRGGRRSSGAVESRRDDGCAFVQRLGPHRLSDHVGGHDGVGRE